MAKRQSAPLSPEIEWYLGELGVEVQPWQAPAIRSPEPGPETGAEFDPERVDRVLEFLTLLRHTQGKLAGQPLEPMDWQIAYIVAPLFGWVAENEDGDWVRYFRRGFVSVARKNSKTTLTAGLMAYLTFGDNESGAQGLCAASTRDQARLAYDPVRLVIENSPAFKTAGIRTTKAAIERLSDGSVLKPVVAEAGALQGLNVHAALTDELHVHKDLSLLNALEAGSGSRTQPMSLVITTADDGRRNSPYDTLVKEAVNAAASDKVDGSRHYGAIWTAPKRGKIDDEATWRAANPGLGQTPSIEYMRAAAAEAKNSPSARAFFQRYHLNQRVSLKGEFISRTQWDKNRLPEPVDEDALVDKPCVGGIDLAAVSDLNALCWLFPDDEGEGVTALWRTWTNEENLDSLAKRTSNAVYDWVDRGFLKVTPGNVADFSDIYDQILADMGKFDVLSVAYDPWNALALIPQLAAEGVPLVKLRQGIISLSPPMKEWQRLVYLGRKNNPVFKHHNPVADWCVGNLDVDMDASGNVKPSKKDSKDKIDLVAAAVDAVSELVAKFGDRGTERESYSGLSLL